MTTKNEDVVSDFVNSDKQSENKNVFIKNNAIYSYGYHFPMGLKLNGCFIINESKYSQSTTRQQNELLRQVGGFKIYKTNTNKLKELIDRGVKSENELILNEL